MKMSNFWYGNATGWYYCNAERTLVRSDQPDGSYFCVAANDPNIIKWTQKSPNNKIGPYKPYYHDQIFVKSPKFGGPMTEPVKNELPENFHDMPHEINPHEPIHNEHPHDHDHEH